MQKGDLKKRRKLEIRLTIFAGEKQNKIKQISREE